MIEAPVIARPYFYTNDKQRQIAVRTIAQVEASGVWPGKVVTEISPAGPFWEAEPEHQDYLERHRMVTPVISFGRSGKSRVECCHFEVTSNGNEDDRRIRCKAKNHLSSARAFQSTKEPASCVPLRVIAAVYREYYASSASLDGMEVPWHTEN